MTVVSEAVSRPQIAIGAGVVPLLALAVFINYVDRGNLATAAPLIKDAFKLSSAQLGLLLSIFFWSYTPCQILTGWLAERINAYRTLALGLAIWSLATVASGLATGFASLLVLRLVLGVGESAAFPCSSKLLAQHLPAQRLGKANGAIGVGLALGPAFGTFAGGMMMAAAGWRTVFVLFGLVSMVWLIPWLWTTRDIATADARRDHGTAPSFIAILRRREAWGACLGHFACNYAFYFVISWLPVYLVKERGFSVAQMAEMGGLIYLVYAASAYATGWISDRLMRRGASSNRVRKTAIVASLAGVAASMFGCAFGGADISVACLFLAGIFFGPGTVSIYAIAQTLAGPRAAGKWVGLQNCIGNVAGILAPYVTGLLVERTGHFVSAFVVACVITVAGIFAWGVMIKTVAPLNWQEANRA